MDGVIERPWGQEIIWTENENYVSKYLLFNGEQSSTGLRMYSKSTKSIFVNEGLFNLVTVNTETGMKESKEVKTGFATQIPPLTPFSLLCLGKAGNILEVSENFEDELFLGK